MRVIDSHTEGEPTRVIFDANLELGNGSLAERAAVFEKCYRSFCGSVLKEPRGNDAYVGALISESSEADCVASIIFFNTIQNLGMCGHGTIGVVATMAYLGLIVPGQHQFETPIGKVKVDLIDSNKVSVINVESYRFAKDVRISTKRHGQLIGDIAWGGNWFFLIKESPLTISLENLRELTEISLDVRNSLETDGITGADGAWIDHIELYGPPESIGANSRSFVLVPSGSYDRSPCGTGCSAKMACLAEDNAWPAGREWTQESIIGSTYAVSYQKGNNGRVVVTVEGSAYVMAEVTLIFDDLDPYREGI